MKCKESGFCFLHLGFFQALESKYETQKAIIIKMEEHLLELYKNPATCPPSELLRSGELDPSLSFSTV